MYDNIYSVRGKDSTIWECNNACKYDCKYDWFVVNIVTINIQLIAGYLIPCTKLGTI